MPTLTTEPRALPPTAAWQEGARAALTHGNFSLAPYSPLPRPSERPAADWAAGFWYARRHRTFAEVLLAQADAVLG